MKNAWWVMGLTLALCPLGLAAQGDSAASTVPRALAASDVAPWTADTDEGANPNFSPGDEIPGQGWVNLLGTDFRGNSSDTVLLSNNQGFAWCAAGSAPFALAHLRVPHGATISHLRLWGWDGTSAGDVSAALLRFCLPDVGPGDSTVTTLVSTSSSGMPGGFTAVKQLVSPVVVDEHTCTYFVELDFGNCDGSGILAAAKVRVQYDK